MIKDKIFRIANKLEKYGESLSGSASHEEIEIFKKWDKDKFDDINTDQYVDFVKIANGLE